MAIQYGYVTMFATAPWAAFLCLLNNLGERKADAMRMLYGEQRPRYQGASSIGAWATVFEILSFVSIATNVAIVGVTSNSLSQIYAMPLGRITLCIVLEHLLLLLKFVVQVRARRASGCGRRRPQQWSRGAGCRAWRRAWRTPPCCRRCTTTTTTRWALLAVSHAPWRHTVAAPHGAASCAPRLRDARSRALHSRRGAYGRSWRVFRSLRV